MPSLIGTTVTNNYLKNVRANGLGPRTVIVKLAGTNITDADLNTVINYLTSAHGVGGTGDSAFVVAGTATVDGTPFVSGVTDNVFLALQGTGDYTVDSSDAHGVSGLATSIIAVFQDNYQNS